MIDITSEKVFPLSRISDHLDLERRGGKRLAASTGYRWRRGQRGVKLETLRVGGTLVTTARCLQEFFDRLSQADAGTGLAPVAAGRQASARLEAIRAADRELDRMRV